MKIIYLNGEGGVCIIHPADGITPGDAARKDVPAGAPYLLINDADIPDDRTFRAAWEADFTNPDGYGIGADAWFAEQQAAAEEAARQLFAEIESRLAAEAAEFDALLAQQESTENEGAA